MGRPPLPVSLSDVEEAAALGMNMSQIADGLGISQRTLYRRKENHSPILAAYKRGSYRAQQQALKELNTHAETQVVASIFKSKHLLGWHDGGPKAAAVAPQINVTVQVGVDGHAAVNVSGEAGSDVVLDDDDYGEIEG